MAKKPIQVMHYFKDASYATVCGARGVVATNTRSDVTCPACLAWIARNAKIGAVR